MGRSYHVQSGIHQRAAGEVDRDLPSLHRAGSGGRAESSGGLIDNLGLVIPSVKFPSAFYFIPVCNIFVTTSSEFYVIL